MEGEFLVLTHLCNELQADLNSSVIWHEGVEHVALSGPEFRHQPLLGSAAGLVPAGFGSSWHVAPAAGGGLPTAENVSGSSHLKVCEPCSGPAFPCRGKSRNITVQVRVFPLSVLPVLYCSGISLNSDFQDHCS